VPFGQETEDPSFSAAVPCFFMDECDRKIKQWGNRRAG
jgi:hypothetical protein